MVFKETNRSVTDSVQLGILITVNTKLSQALAVSVVSSSGLFLKLPFPGQVFSLQHFKVSEVYMKFK